jgi:hypothetical protein
MKRFLLVLLAVAAVVPLLAAPAPAAEFKFGGMWYQKYYYSNNLKDGTDDINDNTRAFYMRMRLYFNAIASENLMAVCKVELDDVWGQGRIGRISTDGGSNLRNDYPTDTTGSANSGFEIKNAYVQFNVPNTPLTFQVGELPILLGYGLAFNDDTNGIVAIGKFDPVKVTLAYSRLNDNTGTLSTDAGNVNTIMTGPMQARSRATIYTSNDNLDLWAADLRIAPTKELALGLTGTYVHQNPHETVAVGGVDFLDQNVDLNLYNVVLDADYKTDLFAAYFTGGKNFGDISISGSSANFEGYLLSLGGTVNVKPVVVGVDFYYTSGQKINSEGAFHGKNFEDYVTPGRDGRFTNMIDEVVFPGMFDDDSPLTVSDLPTHANATNLRGTGITATNTEYTPVNIWAIGAHVDVKPLDQTLIQVGGAYMQYVEDVIAKVNPDGSVKLDDKLGTSLYIRLTQGIVENLQLKAAFGYLFADDGYAPVSNDDNAYKFATGLFWSW